MNDNQKVFQAITGFKVSYEAMAAAQYYDESSIEEIKSIVAGTVENADFIDLDIDASEVEEELVAQAVFDFHACDTGESNDLDNIFKSLKK